MPIEHLTETRIAYDKLQHEMYLNRVVGTTRKKDMSDKLQHEMYLNICRGKQGLCTSLR